jgi:hypothetical protein
VKKRFVIELEGPSTHPVVRNERKELPPAGTGIRVEVFDVNSIWDNATWYGKVVSVEQISSPVDE